MHADAVCLHYRSRAIDVDDQTGQVVALAVNEAVDVITLPTGDSDSAAHIQGSGKAFLPECLVDALTFEGQDAYGNAAYLPMTNSKETSVGGKYLDDIAFLQWRTSLSMMDSAAEYPGMETPEAFLLTPAKNYLFQF